VISPPLSDRRWVDIGQNSMMYPQDATTRYLLAPFLVRSASSYPERGGEILTEPNGDQGGENDPKAGNGDKRLSASR
jgi:hypothetical protein